MNSTLDIISHLHGRRYVDDSAFFQDLSNISCEVQVTRGEAGRARLVWKSATASDQYSERALTHVVEVCILPLRDIADDELDFNIAIFHELAFNHYCSEFDEAHVTVPESVRMRLESLLPTAPSPVVDPD